MDLEIQLRSATDADRGLLREIYAGTREAELAVVPWDADAKRAFVDHQFAAQDDHYRRHYPGATFDVIEAGEPAEAAGRLYVHRGAREIRIMDIALLPAFRGRGIGTRLLQRLIDEARAGGRSLSIHVERTNRARALYERLGFRPVGENGVHLLMASTAAAPVVGEAA
jgi:ribosomal protein S18 acetylase RimI-like enzyme